MNPILFIVPALLMITAIVGIPQDWPTFLVKRRWQLFALSVFVVIGIWLLIMPDYERMGIAFGFKFFILPNLFSGIAAFFMQAGLHTPKTSWGFLAVSLGLLVLVCLSLASDASLGYLGPVIAILAGITTCGIALVAAIWMVWSLHRWRKLVALFIGVIFPVALFFSIQLGYANSPESVIEKNGEAIAQALNQYHADSGEYPSALAVLVPKYLVDLREPQTLWGWLYMPSGDDFTLGYVSKVDKFGYLICKYTAKVPKWDCPLDYSTTPFTLAPTPMP